MNLTSKFPKGFYFGASTSAHQVEGGNENNWSEWEKKNAKRLAREEKKNVKFWDEKRLDGQRAKNFISAQAADHFNRFEEDFNLAKKISLNAYRFSLEWSRVEPEEGVFNEEALDYYHKMIRVLKAYDIEPFVTIWHWTEPLWLTRKGGFKNKKAPKYFARFVKVVAERYKEDIKFWITLNEPEIYSMNSYLRGIWPPQKKGVYNFYLVMRNLVKSHRRAYRIIKKINPRAQIGIAKNNTYFEAANNRFMNRTLKRLADKYWNGYFLDKIASRQDFIGLNYYYHDRIDSGFRQNENKKISDLGWELYPEGIYHVLNDLKKYGKPIYVTENGLADAEDKHRAWYIEEILKNIAQAIKDGVDVRGYFHWSLLDNFEWAHGFWPRFGLIEVDFETQKRTLRKSAQKYADLIRKLSH